MTGSYERKDIVGGAPQTTITGSLTAGATSITIASATGWPDGTNGPFVVALGLGTATEEKVLCTSRTGTTITVETRGYDDTTGVAHDAGTTIDHTLDASTIDQANRHVNLQTAKGAIVIHNGTTTVEFNPGFAGDGSDDNYVLMGADAEGVGWQMGRLETVSHAASAPAVAGYIRVWRDDTSKVVRFSDGTSWIIPSTVASVADDTARNTLVTAAPTAGTIVYREDLNCLEGYVESAWKPLGTPQFANAAARDAYYTSPADGDRAYLTGDSTEYLYRADEWILQNQKITTDASAPSDPHDGDIWFQPVS